MAESYIRWEPHWEPRRILTSLFCGCAEARQEYQFSRSRLSREIALPRFYRFVAHLRAKLSPIQKMTTFAIMGNLTFWKLEVIEEVWNSLAVKFRGFWPLGCCVVDRGVFVVFGFHAIYVAIFASPLWNVGREVLWSQGLYAVDLESFPWLYNVCGDSNSCSALSILRPGGLSEVWTCWPV